MENESGKKPRRHRYVIAGVAGALIIVVVIFYVSLVGSLNAGGEGSQVYMSASIQHLENQTCYFQITLFNNGSQPANQPVFTKIEYSNGDSEILITHISVEATSQTHFVLYMEAHNSVSKQLSDARCYL